ncbi:MAG: hypothetical protein JST16_14530 [Bdellovibrionales bacterium]|nr:hypothetical protein [Bdellovibrionales bacterium]
MEAPIKLSSEVLSAITVALKEEKIPVRQRIAKVLFVSSVIMAALSAAIHLTLIRQLGMGWICAFVAWWLILSVAFGVYWRPVPRLTIRGALDPWVSAKILISMTIATILEILICPSFVLAHEAIGWAPLSSVSHAFMSWGGMEGCMFLCGLIFVGVGSGFTFFLVRKALAGSSSSNFLRAVGMVYLTQLPIIGIQILDAQLRSGTPYWIAGSLTALVCARLLASVVGRS